MDYTQFDHIENWTPFDIMKWHEVCFPLATLESQVERNKQEESEYCESETVEEMADVLISSFGIARFNIRQFIFTHEANMDKLCECEYYLLHTWDKISQAINDKMKINLQRWKDGEWLWDESTQQYVRGK